MTNWTSTDPMTGDVLWQGADADVDAAVAAARSAQGDWALRPLAERIAIAERYAEVVKEKAEDFAALILREGQDRLHFKDNAIQSAAFVVLKSADLPSVLFEAGYITSPEDAAWLRDLAGKILRVGVFVNEPPELPLRLVGITFEAVFALLRAILMLPARLLGGRR